MEHVFKVTITSLKNHTWQGTLRTEDGDFSFNSEIEMLLEMARQLSGEKAGNRKNI